MSAFVVDRVHIDVLVQTALDGPAWPEDGRPYGPGNGWDRLNWYASDPRAVKYDGANPTAYFGGLEEIRRTLTRETADETGEMLITENVASVRYRYDDAGEDLPGPTNHYWMRGYEYTHHNRRLTAVEGLAALNGYEYQACERPDWETSEAHAFCEALRSALIHWLPGYHAAPWSWTADTLAKV